MSKSGDLRTIPTRLNLSSSFCSVPYDDVLTVSVLSRTHSLFREVKVPTPPPVLTMLT